MAATVQLEIQGDSSNFTFDVEGTYYPRFEFEWKDAANPPEVVAVREVWEFRQCKIVGRTGTSADLSTTWTNWLAFVARFKTRGTAFPTYARLMNVGAASALVTLGPPTHDQFKFESVEGELDELTPRASWSRMATCTLRVSARVVNADTNGIVGWDQQVRVTYPDGLQRIEWTTKITTAEGTSAVSKAATYAAIPISTLGGTYLYETNGPDGIDYTYIDADEENSRTPTVCEAVSIVQQYGISVGATSGGNSPSSVSYSVTVRTTAEETITTTQATARGPGCLAFVNGKRPLDFTEGEVLDERALKFASGVWTKRAKRTTKPVEDTWEMEVTLTGGHRQLAFEPVANGGEPVKFEGAFTAWVGVVQVALEVAGNAPTNEEMLLPGHPGEPWVLDHNASEESEPLKIEKARDEQNARWRRSARLVYRSPSRPPGSLRDAILAAPAVVSHFLE
jgi:hypothetical protein